MLFSYDTITEINSNSFISPIYFKVFIPAKRRAALVFTEHTKGNVPAE
jgi:hypothetical protein